MLTISHYVHLRAFQCKENNVMKPMVLVFMNYLWYVRTSGWYLDDKEISDDGRSNNSQNIIIKNRKDIRGNGSKVLESWLIIPLFPVGILLGEWRWWKGYLFYLFILVCIKFLMENYKNNIIEKYIFQKNICSLARLHTHFRIMYTGPVRVFM